MFHSLFIIYKLYVTLRRSADHTHSPPPPRRTRPLLLLLADLAYRCVTMAFNPQAAPQPFWSRVPGLPGLLAKVGACCRTQAGQSDGKTGP